jgi:hypothetical protein
MQVPIAIPTSFPFSYGIKATAYSFWLPFYLWNALTMLVKVSLILLGENNEPKANCQLGTQVYYWFLAVQNSEGRVSTTGRREARLVFHLLANRRGINA